MSLIPTGAYINAVIPWWSQDIFGTPANIEVSTLTVNATPAGNILLENPAPLIFQRPVGDPNAPSESLVMISSIDVPTKPINGQYITATKAAGTAYDDIAVEGIQIFGNQTTSGNSGGIAYITGDSGNLILSPKNSVLISSLAVSSLIAGTIISTAINTATSYTATLFMSTPILYADSISSIGISTNTIQAVTGNFSTLNVSTLNAPSFVASTLSTISIDAKVTLTSTLTLLGVSSVNLGLGDVIQGLVGGAASQGLGAVLGGAALATGAVALVTGRTSGGVNSNVFQTINGSTQLQFSTIGQAVSSVFLTTISPNPLTTPGLETSTTINVAAGTYCVRSVGDPLYITNNVSSIQMFGQWVPVIQPTATASALAISSFNVSSINGAVYPPPGNAGIPSTLAISTATIDGNFTQSGTGTLNWGGNTMSPTQVVLNRATSVNNTFTTSAGVFLNAGATINNGLNVASGGLSLITGNFTMNQAGASANVPILNATQNITTPALSTINISTNNINVNTINNAAYPPPGGGGIPSTLAISTATINGNFTQSGTGTFNWGGNTMSPTQVVLSQPTSVNNTLTTASGAFLNAGATINNTLTVASGGVVVNGSGISISNGGLYVNNATTLNGGLTAFGTATFQNQANFNQNANITGSLVVNNGASLANGVNVTTGNFTMNQFGAIASIPVLNVSQTIRSPALSTINISTGNVNLSSVNGTAYPPPAFIAIPSTINASTINVNGGQTITNGGLVVSGGNVTIQNPATMNNSLTILGQTFAVGGLVVEPPGAVFNGPIGAATTIQVAGLATLNGGARASFISTNTISSASLLISSINNVAYPPPAGIPSTLNASTLNVNGGQTISAGGLTISGGGTITGGGGGPWLYRMASAASATSFQIAAGGNDGFILDLNNNKTTRFYSTLLVRDSTWPNPLPSGAAIRTYDIGDPVPYGSVITSNVSTLNINTSTINNLPYPPPTPPLVPTGSITIWAGGSDGGASFNPQNFAVPTGWLACNGLAVSQIVYNALYSVIGNKFSRGVTPNPGLFFLPDLTFAVPMGTPYRNYFINEDLTKPNFQIEFQEWTSSYVSDPSEACWKILQTIGGTLNLGTKFMGNTVSFSVSGPWPNLYVTKILQYDGNQGYIIVRNENNLLPVPTNNGATLTISANGVVDRFPTITGDYIYTLGSYNVFGNPLVTHNQTNLEAAVHQHNMGPDGQPPFPTGPSIASVSPNIRATLNPGGVVVGQSTISTIGTGPVGFEDVSNIGTYTAPCFINMLYIIKT